MANRFVTEIHANTYDLRLTYPEGSFLAGKERSEMAISSDDHIFISSTSQDPSYYKGYIVKMGFDGNVLWQVQINDDSLLLDGFKGTCVGSLYPTPTGGVICPLQFSTEHLGYNRQYNGAIEIDSSGNVANQNGFFHYDPTYNPLAPVDNIRPAINLRPVINDSCTKMLSATTAYYNGFVPICNTINSSLVFGAKVIWDPLYFDTDFAQRYYTPTFIGDTFASLTPRQDFGVHYIIAKTSGTVMLFARRISSSVFNTWIAETPEGGVICAGRIYLGEGYAFKLDSDLNLVWGKRFGSSGAIAAGCITDVGYCLWGIIDGFHTIFNLDTDGNLLFARKLDPATGDTWDQEQSYMRYTPSQGVTLVSENKLASPSVIRVSQFPSDLSQSITCSIFGDVTTFATSGFTPAWDTVGASTSSAAASFDWTPTISTSSIGGSGYTRICFEEDVTFSLTADYICTGLIEPLSVDFTVTLLTGLDEPPFTYEFDFGDGSPIETVVTTDTSIVVNHVYADLTLHTCTVTVTNNIGKSDVMTVDEECPIVLTNFADPMYKMYLVS